MTAPGIDAWTPKDPRTPVHILTGWLGAGKTTLLNRILSSPRKLRWAVLVNEFGDIGIDDKLVVRSDEDFVELQNGCVCCTIRGDLVKTLLRLNKPKGWRRKPRAFDGILIETTGVARPGPLLRTFLVESQVAETFKLEGFICMVDALNTEAALAESAAVEQVAVADIILLNKVDRAEGNGLDALEKKLGGLNPGAPIFRTVQAEIDIGEVLKSRRQEPNPPPPESTGAPHGDLQALSFRHIPALDEMKVQLWLAGCAQSLGGELIRWKGFLHLQGRPERAILQGVYELYSVEAGPLWGQDMPISELVFIGRGLDEGTLRRGLQACEAGA